MAGEYAVLSKATRKPMARWWARYGVWWLVAIGLCGARDVVVNSILRHAVYPPNYVLALLSFPTTHLLLLLAWVHSALVWLHHARSMFAELAIPEGRHALRARFGGAMLQGLRPLAVWAFFSVADEASKISYYARTFAGASTMTFGSGFQYSVAQEIYNSTATLLQGVSSDLIQVAWLVLIALLLSTQTFKTWLALVAPMVFWSFATGWIGWASSANPSAGYSANQTPSVFGTFLIGAAVVLGMLVFYRRQLIAYGNAMYYFLIACLVMSSTLWTIDMTSNAKWIAVPLHVVRGVTDFWYGNEQISGWLKGQVLEHYPVQQTALGFLEPVLPLLLQLAWLALMFAIVYYVVLAPGQHAEHVSKTADGPAE